MNVKRVLVLLCFALIALPGLLKGQQMATSFDWPLHYPGSSFDQAYSDLAQPFMALGEYRAGKYHLGADLNRGGSSTNECDDHDGVYAVANGKVVFSGDGGDGWGNVVTIEHEVYPGIFVNSLYGHLRIITLGARRGKTISIGEKIGEVGTADRIDGVCGSDPHLHFAIRIRGNGKLHCPNGFLPNDCVGNAYVLPGDPQIQEYTDPLLFIRLFGQTYPNKLPGASASGSPAGTVNPFPSCLASSGDNEPCFTFARAERTVYYDVYLDNRYYDRVVQPGRTTRNPFVYLRERMVPGAHTWKVVSRNFFGLTVGPEWTFTLSTTPACYAPTGVPACTVTKPLLAKAMPQSLAMATVQLAGDVNPSGSLTEYWFEWGLTQNYGNTTPVLTAGTGDTFLPFSATVSNLACGTWYHYRMNARNDVGETLGDDVAFQTTACSVDPPSVMTAAADIPIVGSIKFWGAFNPHGNSTRYWFEWGTETGVYPNSTNALNLGAGTSSTSQSFTTVVGCDPEVIYYRAVAQNDGGRTYGSEASKTMSSCMVAAPTNLTATDNGNGTVTLHWTDNSDNETNFIVSWLPQGGTSYYQRYATNPNVIGWTDTFTFSSGSPAWPSGWADGQYCYRVTAYSYNVPNNTSAPSNTACFAKPILANGNTHSAALNRASQQYFSIVHEAQSGLGTSNDITIEVWVRLASAPTSGTRMGIVSKWLGGPATREYALNYWNSAGTFKLEVAQRENVSGSVETRSVNQTLSIGTYYHIALTLSSGTLRMYVNGLAVGTPLYVTPGRYNNESEFWIGGYDSGSYFDGLIDEVRVWNVARSASQISANYNIQIPCTTNGLVGYWHFNSDATDCTTNGNNLTPVNGPTYSTVTPF